MEETTDLVMAAIALANGVGKAFADDGKITYTDSVYLMEFLAAMPAAATGAEKIPAEIAAMDATQRAELISKAKLRFDIPQKDVEGIVEDAISIAEDLACLFAKMKVAFNG